MRRIDVAISYVDSRDRSIAAALGAALESLGLASFVALQRQDELIGLNGVNLFRLVFGWQARVIIVLCREEWGKTPFTKVESDAIRFRRWFDWRPFVIIILMETSRPPSWYPETHIYGRFEQLGVERIARTASDRARKFDASSARRTTSGGSSDRTGRGAGDLP